MDRPLTAAALGLRPANPGTGPCKVCDGVARPFGVTDFNRSCEEVRGKGAPPSGVEVAYRRCDKCGLLFTEAFDDWSFEDFKAYIYNAAYGDFDPDYEVVRPVGNAALIVRGFAQHAGSLRVLDYGGGNGRLAAELRKAGFSSAATYDPFHDDHAARPDQRFDLVTCFETLEHMPDPVAGAVDIASLLADNGLLLFSTLVQPADFAGQGMGWWYIGPRNGHVTLHSRASLRALWARLGLQFGSFSDNIHAAYRTVPEFARALLTPRTA